MEKLRAMWMMVSDSRTVPDLQSNIPLQAAGYLILAAVAK